jgi:XTP/dITP diphosphohydrolase
MQPIQRILIATHNPGKVTEYAQLMSELPVRAISLDEAGITMSVDETGSTFEENARLKAVGYAEASGLLTLADDSGLEVDALGGEPGINSARYSGPDATDSDRYYLVLQKLEGVPPHQRAARFRCAIALATPGGEVYIGEGVVEGMIASAPRGDFGFGYDPIFFLPEYGATMAELRSTFKNAISHRARAFQAVLPHLQTLLAAGQ